MESTGILDPDNEDHLFCLHELYKPVINDALRRFCDSWMNHKLRTAANKTPLQLFIMGMQQIGREDSVIPNEYFENLGEVRYFGNLIIEYVQKFYFVLPDVCSDFFTYTFALLNITTSYQFIK
jgi:hypothetical protein